MSLGEVFYPGRQVYFETPRMPEGVKGYIGTVDPNRRVHLTIVSRLDNGVFFEREMIFDPNNPGPNFINVKPVRKVVSAEQLGETLDFEGS